MLLFIVHYKCTYCSKMAIAIRNIIEVVISMNGLNFGKTMRILKKKIELYTEIPHRVMSYDLVLICTPIDNQPV